MKQWYDGWGHLVETQMPSPTSGKTIVTYTVYDNMGRPATKSLPYAVSTPTGYLAPDLTQARSVTAYDGLGRSLGTVTYDNNSQIVLSTSLSYIASTGVPTLNTPDSGYAYEQTITQDAYNHQSISYTDALGRLRFTQVFSGKSSPYSVVRTVDYHYDYFGDVDGVLTYDSTGTVQASYGTLFDGSSGARALMTLTWGRVAIRRCRRVAAAARILPGSSPMTATATSSVRPILASGHLHRLRQAGSPVVPWHHFSPGQSVSKQCLCAVLLR